MTNPISSSAASIHKALSPVMEKPEASEDVNEEFLKAVEKAKITFEDTFKFSDKKLVDPIVDWSDFSSIRHIDLSSNFMTQIPSGACQLTHLISLDLRNNKITDFSVELFSSPSLSVVNLANNRIASIPSRLPESTSLSLLDLSGNPIKRLPDSILHIPRLTLVLSRTDTLQDLAATLNALNKRAPVHTRIEFSA